MDINEELEENISEQINPINEIINNDIIEKSGSYPKNEEKNKKTKSIKVSCHKKLLKNPGISHFTSSFHFIYDIDVGFDYINNSQDPQKLKLSKNEIETFYKIKIK